MNSSETEISPWKLSSSQQDVVRMVMPMIVITIFIMMMFEEFNVVPLPGQSLVLNF